MPTVIEQWPFCPAWDRNFIKRPDAQELDLKHRIAVTHQTEVCICGGMVELEQELLRRGFNYVIWKPWITWPKWLSRLTTKWGRWGVQ